MNTCKEIQEFISKVSEKYNIPKDKIKSCAPLSIKKRILFSSINRETIVLTDKYKVLNGTVVSKIDDTMLDKSDILFLETNNVKYILPLSMDTQVYETKITPISDFDLPSEDEYED